MEPGSAHVLALIKTRGALMRSQQIFDGRKYYWRGGTGVP
jgi:hypothetical protein